MSPHPHYLEPHHDRAEQLDQLRQIKKTLDELLGQYSDTDSRFDAIQLAGQAVHLAYKEISSWTGGELLEKVESAVARFGHHSGWSWRCPKCGNPCRWSDPQNDRLECRDCGYEFHVGDYPTEQEPRP